MAMIKPAFGPLDIDLRMVYVSSDPGIIAPEKPTPRAPKNIPGIGLMACSFRHCDFRDSPVPQDTSKARDNQVTASSGRKAVF